MAMDKAGDNKSIVAGRVGTIEGQRFVVYDRDYVRAQLEDAGKTLMALRPGHVGPKGYMSAMPEPLQEFWDVYGHHAPNVRWPQPTQRAIDRMDKILPWLGYVEDQRKRRIVAARMLTHPLSDRPILRWDRIANTFGIPDRTARRWHADGLDDIASAISGPTRY